MKYSTYTQDLVRTFESASLASCKAQAVSIDSIHQNNQPKRNKKSKKKDKTLKKSYSITLAQANAAQDYERWTWNPVLREIVTRLKGQDQENRTQQKTSRIVQSGLTNKNPALGEADLEPSATRGTNRTEALVILVISKLASQTVRKQINLGN